ncbi:hypothetical protein BpHYR1_037789 [Brachionus plicatilis]|uniref:Uncharacterized protein n=1 Tax=Brachionus plicatilis TaxID=10195 RepID=A0A3M7PBC6_BRAPC|nr:hypothetical protein BpHYR1_037789 [Brachionus plicatilis]
MIKFAYKGYKGCYNYLLKIEHQTILYNYCRFFHYLKRLSSDKTVGKKVPSGHRNIFTLKLDVFVCSQYKFFVVLTIGYLPFLQKEPEKSSISMDQNIIPPSFFSDKYLIFCLKLR